MSYLRTYVFLLGVTGMLGACAPQEGSTTGAVETGSGEPVTMTQAQTETSDDTAATGETDGPTAGSATDTGTVTETAGATETGAETDTGGDTETGGEENPLAQCMLDEPCPEIKLSCDYDGCANDMLGDDDMCVWALLRDNAAVRVRTFEDLGLPEQGVWVVEGSEGRSVLRSTQAIDLGVSGPLVFERCTLAGAPFWQGCLDNPQDDCFDTLFWVVGCVPEPAPICP